MTPQIDVELYRRLFAELAAIGAGPAGWNRLAWGPLEDDARSWFMARATDLGLELEQDGAGNLWAIEPDAGAAPLVCAGSHVDTVLDGGAYDGALGVVSALVAVEAVRREARGPRRPLAVGCMVDEEGPRFDAAIFGSRILCGELEIEPLLARVDRDGHALGELAAARGVTPASLASAPSWLGRIALWLEVHVEQGAALVDVPAALGIASGLAPRERWRATFAGAANHAGTTPMAGRRDALVAAARVVLAAETLARGEPGAVATVGRIDATPGASNVIPGGATLTLDVRARAGEALARVRDGVFAAAGASDGVTVRWSRESADPGSLFDGELRATLTRAAAAAGVAAGDLWAYAGHDAGVLARHVPAAMLFVRNPTGVSHHPDEFSSEDDCLAGCRVLAGALADLA
ncbi:MAG: beta-ureidopropionase / N-carbamoyl-L-amino-acid hydrolase [Gaiellales bacterium]|nr:beta-ureidopropionase / N-carbamoyl-L-amino-acid hydrolase [Gaiellales bacterium]